MKNATPPRFLVRLVLAGAALATVTAAFCQSGQMNYAPVPQARPQAAISGNLDNAIDRRDPGTTAASRRQAAGQIR